MQKTRHYSPLDSLLIQIDQGVRVVFGRATAQRQYPAAEADDNKLNDHETRDSSGMMRVNHTGEICAQALYNGQLVTAKNPQTRQMLAHAAEEETDHLAWCEQRLDELGSHTSYLNALWYWNSFAIGMLAGLCGDKVSLGFVEETEAQVGNHLSGHLDRLPVQDVRSRAVVQQMATDEAEHGQAAVDAGGKPLPTVIKSLMKLTAKVMTTVAYRI